MSEAIRDAAARAQALDTRRSFLVQAPAGSGKTELLIRRFLALLGEAEQPEEIVAITFTRKAAAEMLVRILDALNSAFDPPPQDEYQRETQELARKARLRDQQHGWTLETNPRRLRVQTIDALCGAIASTWPLSAGTSFGAIEEDPRPRYLEAARRTIRELASPDDATRNAMRRLLLHVDGEAGTLQDLLAQMLAARDQWARYLPAGDGGALRQKLRQKLEEALQHRIVMALGRVRAAIPPHLADRLLECMRSGARNAPPKNEDLALWADVRKLPAATLDALPLWQAMRKLLLTTSKTWRTTINAGCGFPARNKAEQSAMAAVMADLQGEDALLDALLALTELPPAAFDEAQWQIAEALFRALPAALRHLREVFEQNGVSDFAEVAEAARRVLKARRTGAHDIGIRHLLVDEYQDTSVTQQELLELIAGRENSDGRTLFLVGDPMQSIYGFRQAEVGLFLEAQRTRRIGEVELGVLRLERNFRSGAAVVNWVNSTFAQVFPGHDDVNEGAVSYAPMAPEQRRSADVRVHAFLSNGDRNAADREEAERVADLIARFRMRSPNATIAILVSARSHVREIAPALTARGLRFRAVEIRELGEVQVVRDLHALTRALLHHADRIAWLAILRGPWCGLELRDCELLCGGEEDRYACLPELMQRNLARLSQEGQQRVGRVSAVMEAAQAQRGRLPLAQFVEGTWIALGGPACISAGDLEDAQAFLRTVSKVERAGEIADRRALEAELEKLFAAPDPDADGRLEIMTIHRAKGLEFDMVIVPQLGRVPPPDDQPLLLWQESAGDSGAELLLAPIAPKGGETDPLYKYLERAVRARRKQESKRLLYVAATRARSQLHLMGCAAIDGHGDLSKPDSRSLLSHLWPVVEPEFQRAHQAFVPKQPVLFSMAASADAPAMRRLPLDWHLPAAPQALEIASPLAIASRSRDVTFEWASNVRRAVGTVVHSLLQRIAQDGLPIWTPQRVEQESGNMTRALGFAGVAEVLLPKARDEVTKMISATLANQRGRWCLDAHQIAESELNLSGVIDGRLYHVRIDRTFVCEGVRWIIDYKTGAREGGGIETFFDNEVQRYSEQLATYTALLKNLDDRPVRVGLYFPASGGWREWQAVNEV